jgi:hypothetical protein
MPHFLATAVFEVRASSQEAADRAAAEVLQELHHPRVRYLEHNISGSLGSAYPGKDLFFAVIGDFDVDAPTEERADDLVKETLDALSTDFVQYLTHGLVEGGQGGRAEKEGREERPAKRRGERKEDHAVETPPEKQEVAGAAAKGGMEELPVPHPEAVSPPVVPEPAHPPLFPSIRISLTVTLQTSELARASDSAVLPDEEALIMRAIEEARPRYPEIPTHLSPQSSFSPGSGEQRLVTLIWEYEVPLPSSSSESQAAS